MSKSETTNGNLVQFTDRKGQVSQFDYDELDRRTHAGYADGSSTNFTYDLVGRLKQINDSISGYIQMGYDNLDRLTQEITPQGVVSYTYDSIGRRTSMSVNGLSPVTYDYDDASRLTQVAQASQVVNLAYDPAGRRTSLAYPNGTNTSYFYDDASRVTEIFHNGPGGPIEDLFYTYDASGNRISFSRTGPQADLPAPIQAAHNAANQLVQFNSDSMTYDANGNLTSDGTATYTWDGRNRLSDVNDPSFHAQFTYDALNRRVQKTINNVSVSYQYDGENVISELADDSIITTYLRSLRFDEPFVRQRQDNEYFHFDALSSPIKLTDSSGSVQTIYAYTPFGGTTVNGTTMNPFQFTGREADGDGLFYYRARYFNPNLRRFISEDPLQLAGLDINLYVYAFNNPVNLRDPTGKLVVQMAPCNPGAGRKDNFFMHLFRAYACDPSTWIPGPAVITSSERNIAKILGKTLKEIKNAIHEVKGKGIPKYGPITNPNVKVDTVTGEVYPITPTGEIGDSIGNIFDYLE